MRIIRVAETNLGDLCATPKGHERRGRRLFVNGGIRTNIKAGDVTYNDILKVHPLATPWVWWRPPARKSWTRWRWAPGWCPRKTAVSSRWRASLYEIHTYVPNSVKLTDEGMFVAVEGEYRVKNVMVGERALDLAKTYTMAPTTT